MKTVPRMNSGCDSGPRRTLGRLGHRVGVAGGGQPVVEERERDPADQRAPPGARPAQHHHHQQRQGQVRRRPRAARRRRRAARRRHHPAAASAPESTNASSRNRYGSRPSTSTRRSSSRTAASTRPAGASPTRCTTNATTATKASASQYRFTVLTTPTSAVGQPGAVERQALLAAGEAARVAGHRDRADLGERERHHGEGDALGAQRDRAQQQRRARSAPAIATSADHPQWPVGPVEQDRRAVDAGREVERVPEGQHPGAAEHQVVAEREAAEDEADREQLQGARRVQRRRRRAPGCPGWSTAARPTAPAPPPATMRRTRSCRVPLPSRRPDPAAGPAAPARAARPRRRRPARARSS